MNCLTGCLTIVDLSSGRTERQSITEEDFEKFLGGNGLAIKLFLDKVAPGIEPFSPENILFFGTGPITGTGVQGTDRTFVAAKSPLTGLFFDCTFGGRFASCLKQNGHDAIAVSGKAEGPCYIWVGENGVEIRDADDLWGKNPEEVREALAAKLKDFELCAIGVAGENQARFASIMHPRGSARGGAAGRGGLGAVMGSKNVKAIVVDRAKRKKPGIYSSELLKDAKEKIQANLEKKSAGLTALGTAFGVNLLNSFGALGTRNLTDETFAQASEISGEKLKEQYYRKNIACNSCPVACGKLCELDGRLIKNPEYETLFALGSMLEIADIEGIMRANVLCDEFGLDTISMGLTVAFAVECFEKGLLSLEQTGGRPLRFGDAGLLLKLIEDTAHRNGLGNLLAEGTKRMADAIGGESWKFAHQVKGLEVAGHSARVVKTLSVGYATNTRGGSHMDARVRYGPGMETYEGKTELAVATQNLCAVGDSLVHCRFITEQGLGPTINDEYGNLLKAVCGWGPSTSELNEVAERIITMERLFNVREGITRKDDTLPYKVMWEEIATGPFKGHRVPPEKLEELLDAYYELRGWDKNGIPCRETLERLGLGEYTL